MNDSEIASKVNPLPILEIGKKLGLKEEQLICYGMDKAKIDPESISFSNPQGKLILVTSTSPTPFGEGKTTLSIGIHDSLCRIGKRSCAVLREPSLGPVFGIKGGATGGGYSQVIPMDEINLHFTGDIHAITAANNLLSAVIDNHLFHQTSLELDPSTISFSRCMDMNDRALRTITLNKIDRTEHFHISTASEIMAILCLSNSMEELKERLGSIYIGKNKAGEFVYARDLNCVGAMAILLKDALKPNLVQTLEGNPVLIHGGPFANIAHGCNSVIATKVGLNIADYVVTEAGFGSDMGGVKFFDIKGRESGISPDLVVLNTSVRGLKYNGHKDLEQGFANLEYHIYNMKKFCSKVLVVLNLFETDTEEEQKQIATFCKQHQTPFTISNCYQKGSLGGITMAEMIVSLTEEETKKQLPVIYSLEDSLEEKITTFCKEIYYAKEVVFLEKARKKLKEYSLPLPICIAKTQYSITDDPQKLGFPKGETLTVTDLKLNHGAGFITVLMGNVMTMPGLSEHANYEKMDYLDGKITGLF